jgi:hypothetical protein
MQGIIESAIQIFRSNPDLDEEELLERLIESGIERKMAIQLVALLPLAYGREVLSDTGVLFSDFYVYVNEPGRGRLSALPLWAEVVEFAKQDPEAAFPIASRSPEIRAANEGLNDGQTLNTLVWGPVAFLWPLEPIPGLEKCAKKPGWWRQIWDGPALHSVTTGQRTLARIAMVIGILAGLLALGVLAYYTISLLREVL